MSIDETMFELQGEFGTLLDWVERTGKPGYRPDPDTATSRVSASVKARGVCGSTTSAPVRQSWRTRH